MGPNNRITTFHSTRQRTLSAPRWRRTSIECYYPHVLKWSTSIDATTLHRSVNNYGYIPFLAAPSEAFGSDLDSFTWSQLSQPSQNSTSVSSTTSQLSLHSDPPLGLGLSLCAGYLPLQPNAASQINLEWESQTLHTDPACRMIEDAASIVNDDNSDSIGHSLCVFLDAMRNICHIFTKTPLELSREIIMNAEVSYEPIMVSSSHGTYEPRSVNQLPDPEYIRVRLCRWVNGEVEGLALYDDIPVYANGRVHFDITREMWNIPNVAVVDAQNLMLYEMKKPYSLQRNELDAFLDRNRQLCIIDCPSPGLVKIRLFRLYTLKNARKIKKAVMLTCRHISPSIKTSFVPATGFPCKMANWTHGAAAHHWESPPPPIPLTPLPRPMHDLIPETSESAQPNSAVRRVVW